MRTRLEIVQQLVKREHLSLEEACILLQEKETVIKEISIKEVPMPCGSNWNVQSPSVAPNFIPTPIQTIT